MLSEGSNVRLRTLEDLGGDITFAEFVYSSLLCFSCFYVLFVDDIQEKHFKTIFLKLCIFVKIFKKCLWCLLYDYCYMFYDNKMFMKG